MVNSARRARFAACSRTGLANTYERKEAKPYKHTKTHKQFNRRTVQSALTPLRTPTHEGQLPDATRGSCRMGDPNW